MGERKKKKRKKKKERKRLIKDRKKIEEMCSGSKKKEGKGERAICLSARRKDEGDSSEREGPKF